MKTSRALPFLLSFAATTASAQVAMDLGRWHFNGGAATPTFGTGTVAASGLSAGIYTGTGSATNYPASIAASNDVSFSAFAPQNTGSNTRGMETTVSTVGVNPAQYGKLRFYFDWRASTSAPRHAQVAYSVDGGANWTDLGGSIAQPTGLVYRPFRPTAYANDATSFVVTNPAAYGISNLKFRVMAVFAPSTSTYVAAQDGSAYSVSGTWRFDNVGVEAVPEPASIAVLGLGLAAFRRRRTRS